MIIFSPLFITQESFFHKLAAFLKIFDWRFELQLKYLRRVGPSNEFQSVLLKVSLCCFIGPPTTETWWLQMIQHRGHWTTWWKWKLNCSLCASPSDILDTTLHQQTRPKWRTVLWKQVLLLWWRALDRLFLSCDANNFLSRDTVDFLVEFVQPWPELSLSKPLTEKVDLKKWIWSVFSIFKAPKLLHNEAIVLLNHIHTGAATAE